MIEKVPESETPEGDSRTFVKQLTLIGLNRDRIRKAQENHYKAVAQRSRWIRSNLLDITELDDFEMRLLSEWEEFYAIMTDDLDGDTDVNALRNAGDDLYKHRSRN